MRSKFQKAMFSLSGQMALALLLFNLGMAGCDAKDYIKTQYSAEKKFDRCVRGFQQVSINPTLVSTEQFEEAAKKFRDFLGLYENTASSSPSIAELCKRTHFYLASLSILQGDYKKAVYWYEITLKKFPDDSKHLIEAYLSLAKAYQQLLELQLASQSYRNVVAEEDFNDFLKKNPQLISLPLYIARLNRLASTNGTSTRTYDEVASYYKNLISKSPNSELTFLAKIQLANSYADQKQWHQCLKFLASAVQMNPTNTMTHKVLLSMAEVEAEIYGNYTRSRSYYDRVLAESDDSEVKAKAHFGLASLLFRQSRNEEARKKMLWLVENFPRQGRVGAKALLSVAYSYEQEQKWDRALVQYRWLMDTYPLTSEGLYAPLHVANHFKQTGELELAETSYLEATQRYFGLISKYPQSQVAALAQEYLTICYTLNEDWDIALNSAKQLYDGYKTVPQIAMGSLIMLAQLYEKNQKYDAAVEIYEDFLRKFAGHPLAAQIKNRVKTLKPREGM